MEGGDDDPSRRTAGTSAETSTPVPANSSTADDDADVVMTGAVDDAGKNATENNSSTSNPDEGDASAKPAQPPPQQQKTRRKRRGRPRSSSNDDASETSLADQLKLAIASGKPVADILGLAKSLAASLSSSTSSSTSATASTAGPATAALSWEDKAEIVCSVIRSKKLAIGDDSRAELCTQLCTTLDIQFGAVVETKKSDFEDIPIHVSAQEDNVPVCVLCESWFLSPVSAFSLRNMQGGTVLHTAARYGAIRVINHILDTVGKDAFRTLLRMRSKARVTAFDVAAEEFAASLPRRKDESGIDYRMRCAKEDAQRNARRELIQKLFLKIDPFFLPQIFYHPDCLDHLAPMTIGQKEYLANNTTTTTTTNNNNNRASSVSPLLGEPASTSSTTTTTTTNNNNNEEGGEGETVQPTAPPPVAPHVPGKPGRKPKPKPSSTMGGDPSEAWESPDRLASIMGMLQPLDEDGRLRVRQDFEAVDRETLELVHSREYVDFVHVLSEELATSADVVPFTPRVQAAMQKVDRDDLKDDDLCDTGFSEGTLRSALRAAGSVCAAVDSVLNDETRRAFCVVRPPGHHAGRNGLLEESTSCGFCVFNNVMVGVMHALETRPDKIKKVAVLDIDVHHGNGTEEIIKEFHDRQPEGSAPKILFLSTHLHDRSNGAPDGGLDSYQFYPGTGEESDAPHNVYNMPLKPLWRCRVDPGAKARLSKSWVERFYLDHFGRREYRRVLEDRILPPLRAFHPDLILVSAGFDAAFKDLGNYRFMQKPLVGFDLDRDDFHWIAQEVGNIAEICCEGRLVSVLEGGYGRIGEGPSASPAPGSGTNPVMSAAVASGGVFAPSAMVTGNSATVAAGATTTTAAVTSSSTANSGSSNNNGAGGSIGNSNMGLSSYNASLGVDFSLDRRRGGRRASSGAENRIDRRILARNVLAYVEGLCGLPLDTLEKDRDESEDDSDSFVDVQVERSHNLEDDPSDFVTSDEGLVLGTARRSGRVKQIGAAARNALTESAPANNSSSSSSGNNNNNNAPSSRNQQQQYSQMRGRPSGANATSSTAPPTGGPSAGPGFRRSVSSSNSRRATEDDDGIAPPTQTQSMVGETKKRRRGGGGGGDDEASSSLQQQQQQQAPNAGQPPTITANKDEAVEYLVKIRNAFPNDDNPYNTFLGIMSEFKDGRLDVTGVVNAVKRLFSFNHELCLGFNAFLPPQMHIKLSDLQ